MLALLRSQSELKKIQENPELIPKAVDEMARYDGSVPRSWRITKKEMIIAGVAVPKNQLVLPLLSSANRDELEFENPDVFDLSRDTRKHLAFGRGVHVCLGAPLARIEGQEIIKQMISKFPNITLNESPERLIWRKDVALRGLESLQVKL